MKMSAFNMFLFLGLINNSCAQSNKIAVSVNMSEIDSSYYEVYSFKMDLDDSTKLGFEVVDAFHFGVEGLAFLGEKELVVSDTYNNNIKLISLTDGRAIITRTIGGYNKLGFSVGDCEVKDDLLYILDYGHLQFLVSDLQFSNADIRALNSEPLEGKTSFSLFGDSLYIPFSSIHIPFTGYFSCQENRIYREDADRYKKYNENSISFKLKDELKQLSNEQNPSFRKYIDNSSILINAVSSFKSSDGTTKYAFMSFREESQEYDLVILSVVNR